MAGGHSLCSATMKHFSHSAFMAPGDAALSAAGCLTVHPAAAAAVKIPSTEVKMDESIEQTRTLAKMEKQKAHLERTITEMSAARDRSKVRIADANYRGSRDSDRGDRGDRDRSRDTRRSDDRR